MTFLADTKFWDLENIGDSPVAISKFKYRSMDELRALHILREATPAELRELVRRMKDLAVEQRVKEPVSVKHESKRKRAAEINSVTKKDYDKGIEIIEVRKAKRPRREV
ncbi:hypothetical protein EJ02DRAFT_430867 [Clathrospora elynae]|uniref:Uncharacterized protein n=1 Tax=Clathrospora elynae TaxID=706981 RepID=A0A6A5T127_9PLEO|nr:hypothetical protein EJ02DRAFT_430867 [Clathrospora elynae]